jgi:hypothetical protein
MTARIQTIGPFDTIQVGKGVQLIADEMQPSLLTELLIFNQHITGVASALWVRPISEQHCFDALLDWREVICCLERWDKATGIIDVCGRLSNDDVNIRPVRD